MKITCNIVQDLLPLYVDEALSEDSRMLVEEHLEGCGTCRKAADMLKEEQKNIEEIRENGPRDEDIIKAFVKIRRKIWRKRIFAVCLAVICVILAVRVKDYIYFDWARYIPFEETGLEMRDGKLYATKTYAARLRSIVSPDQKVQFLYETETLYAKREYPVEVCDVMIKDYAAMMEEPETVFEPETSLYGIEKLYYLPEEYLKYKFDYEDPEIGEQQTKELESQSLLLWDGTKETAEQQEKTEASTIKSTEETAAENTAAKQDSDDNVGKGFVPDADTYTRDKRGNYVDEEGNTFNIKGQWQVPEGGHVDSRGRIIDKNGNVMGGGAAVGSVG